MKKIICGLGLLLCCGRAYGVPTETPTRTPTNTPTDTPVATPIARGIRDVARRVNYRTATTGILVGTEADKACIVSLALEPTSANTEVTLTDASSTVIFGAKFDNLSLYFGQDGPCLTTPVSVGGTGRVTIGWANHGTE